MKLLLISILSLLVLSKTVSIEHEKELVYDVIFGLQYNWKSVGERTLSVEVDYTHGNFVGVPAIATSLSCDYFCSNATGMTSILKPNSTGFRVEVTNDRSWGVGDALSDNWKLHYIVRKR